MNFFLLILYCKCDFLLKPAMEFGEGKILKEYIKACSLLDFLFCLLTGWFLKIWWCMLYYYKYCQDIIIVYGWIFPFFLFVWFYFAYIKYYVSY